VSPVPPLSPHPRGRCCESPAVRLPASGGLLSISIGLGDAVIDVRPCVVSCEYLHKDEAGRRRTCIAVWVDRVHSRMMWKGTSVSPSHSSEPTRQFRRWRIRGRDPLEDAYDVSEKLSKHLRSSWSPKYVVVHILVAYMCLGS
jgi:hypothetical protein